MQDKLPLQSACRRLMFDNTDMGDRSKRQDTPLHCPLAGKNIFLDVPGFPGASALEDDIKRLGGAIEECFSKECGLLITNNKTYLRELEAVRNPAKSPSNPSPSPSHFNTAGIHGAVDLPQAASPWETCGLGGSKPMTRGMAMVQRATNSKNDGSTNLVEIAKQWKITIISLDQAQKYVTTELAKLPLSLLLYPQKEKESKRKDYTIKKKNAYPLKGHFVKYESATQQYKPVNTEFAEFPRVNTETVKGSCPFGNQTKERKQRAKNAEQNGEKEVQERKIGDSPAAIPVVKHTRQKHDSTRSIGKRKQISTLYSRNMRFKADKLRRIKIAKARAEHKKGYCEPCNVTYDDIDMHVKMESHKKFVRNETNYSSLDLIIARGPSMEQFLDEVLKDPHEHVKDKEGLQMSEMEDEVMLISQGGSESGKKLQETTKKEPTTSPNVQFPTSSEVFTSAAVLQSKLPDACDAKDIKLCNTPSEKDKVHDKASKWKDVLHTEDTESKLFPAKIPKLEIIEVDQAQVSLKQSYSSPIKQDPNEQRIWEEDLRAKCEDQKVNSPKTPRRRKRVKVKHQWSILSDRSMKKMLLSDGDHEFEGFNETNQNLPTDVSYVDVSEISVSDNSDMEWNLDSYSKSPEKKRFKVQPNTDVKPSAPSPLVKALSLTEEPNMDIVEESCSQASNWEDVKGVKIISESYFNPYLQGIQQEKLWLNSLPVKEQETPVKQQEEAESLPEGTPVELLSLETPIKLVNKMGPVHSTPMADKQTHSPRRSPRKRSKSEMEDPVDTTPVSKSQKKSVPKHIPAEVVDGLSENVRTQDMNILATTPGIASNIRLLLTIMKSRKKGCLCHKHTADSSCPLSKNTKKPTR